MKKIIEYCVCSDIISYEYLSEDVNEYIAKGWQPFGQIVVSQRGHTILYAQAIVKYEE